MNSLAQTLVKLTAPGVPDTYQGTELWDYSLVDPDNRRPVNYEIRRRALDQLHGVTPSPELCHELLEHLADGSIKLWTIARSLELRRGLEALFKEGAYTALAGEGDRANHVVAYARTHGEQAVIAIAPRFTYTLSRGRAVAPLGDVWGNTSFALPQTLTGGEWSNVFTGERIAHDDRMLLRDALRSFPVALLRRVA
jgi:(1->4)-alpha-D-glucan 1-alpha-D-glucosylmutase